MTGDRPVGALPAEPAANDLATIPILMEPVPEAPAPAAAAAAQVTQRSLFDDADTPANDPARRPARRAAPSPELARAAGHILRARAPAIIDEIVEAQSARLAVELRARLQAELETLLDEMAGDTPGANR